MRAAPIVSRTPAQTALVSFVNALALACLALVMAYWTWRWLLPPPEPTASGIGTAEGGVARARALFGESGATTTATATASGIRLLGVVAASGDRVGYALLQVNGRPMAALRVGAELAPGLVLAEVHPRQVVLLRAGVRESVVLPQPAAPLPPPSVENPMPNSAAPSVPQGPPRP